MIRVKKWLDRKLNYVFTIPTILFVLGMVLFPIIYTFVLSFHSWRMSANIPWKFVGLDNYVELFSDSRFPNAVLRTFIFALIALAFEIVLGMVIAIYLDKVFFGKNFVKTAFLLPMVATPVAIGMVWKLIYEPNIGILNTIIRNMNGPKIDWLGDSGKALYSLVVVDVWQWTPFVMLIISAGLTSIPLELFEAAMVDGASGIKIVFKVTLPLLRPTIYTAVLLRLIDVLKTFDIIYSMTSGGPGDATQTVMTVMMKKGISEGFYSTGSAFGVCFFIIVLAISAIVTKLMGKWSEAIQ